MGEPAEQQRHEIRVRGHLGETLLAAFPGLRARAQGGATVLAGELPDQAALVGVLAKIEAPRRASITRPALHVREDPPLWPNALAQHGG